MKRLSLSLLALSICPHLFGQISGKSLHAKFSKHVIDNLQEKAYIVTNQPYYAIGDTIWYQSYLVDAITHKPLTLSDALYVDLLNANGEILESQILKVNNGGAPGNFVIKRKWPQGKYQLRAYTKWMQNFNEQYLYYKAFDVLDFEQESDFNSSNESPDIDITMFPEGGELVEGHANKVTVKLRTLQRNDSLNMTGSVKSSSGEVLTQFETNQDGFGMFYLTNPTEDVKIDINSARITEQDLEISKHGYNLQILSRLNSETIRIVAKTNHENGLKGCKLIGHTRGQVFTLMDLSNLEGVKEKLFLVKKNRIPTGVAHFSLLDSMGMPLCERLAYIQNNSPLREPEILISKPSFQQREMAELTITLPDTSQTMLSVSVLNSDVIPSDEGGENLFSYLMLDSDLQEGYGCEFDLPLKDKEEHNELDVMMMASKWGRYDWKYILSNEERTLKYDFERGITFTGTILDITTQSKPRKAYVQLTTLNLDPDLQSGFNFINFETLDDGKFLFGELEFYDEVKVLIQSKKEEEDKNPRYHIRLDGHVTPLGRIIPNVLDIENDQAARFKEMSKEVFQINRSYSNDVTFLDEVIVEDTPIDVLHKMVGGRYEKPDYRVITDSISASVYTLMDILRQVPYVFVNSDGTIGIRDSNLTLSVALYLDGRRIDPSAAPNIISATDAKDIYFVDLDREGISDLRIEPALYVYTRTANGIPMRTTNTLNTGKKSFTHPGFAKAAQFYTPIYEKKKKAKPDKRPAIYWNPNLIVKDGKATVSFYTGDLSGPFKVKVEGINQNGEVVLGSTEFVVN